MVKAIIFDLDDTLVRSQTLRALRDAGSWDLLLDRIGEVQAYQKIPELLRFWRSRGIRIGIVTSAPRPYAEQVLNNCSLEYDALVAYGEAKYQKPNPAPMITALNSLRVTAAQALAVGDRCVDIASAKGAGIPSVGSMWGCANIRDLKMAYPEFLATSPPDLLGIVPESSKGAPLSQGTWQKEVIRCLWLRTPDWDRRPFLTPDSIPYQFARVYYGSKTGTGSAWSISYTNSLILNLKEMNPSLQHHKIGAARQFASELSHGVASGSQVAFVMPSAPRGSQDFDNRWDLVRGHLESLRPDLGFTQPIEVTVASTPAHRQEPSSPDRNPEIIKSRLRWVGGYQSEPSHVTIVDDVLTKGGHLRAYHDLVRQHHPKAEISLMPWAVYVSTPWHASPLAGPPGRLPLFSDTGSV